MTYEIAAELGSSKGKLERTVSDLILGEEACLLWLIVEKEGEFEALSLAVNYGKIGSRLWRGEVLVQDPVGKCGPYFLDRARKLFVRENKKGVRFDEIIKVPAEIEKFKNEQCYYLIGDSKEMVDELMRQGYLFRG